MNFSPISLHRPRADGLRLAARGAKPALGVFLLSTSAAFLLAPAEHPELTLSFSEGVPSVPLPGSMWLLAGGMLALIETRRRQRGQG